MQARHILTVQQDTCLLNQLCHNLEGCSSFVPKKQMPSLVGYYSSRSMREKLPSICHDLQGEFDWNHCNYELLFDQEQGRTYWLLWEGQILLEIDTQFFLFLVEELWIWGKNGRGLPLWEVQLITPGIVLSVRDRQMAFQVGENILNLLIGHPGGGKSTRGSKSKHSEGLHAYLTASYLIYDNIRQK